MIFDVGLGDLFVIRNAGQVLAETILGSLEFAVEVIGVPLILTLGHDQCGAIKAGIAAQEGTLAAKGEFIHNIVNRITPTIERGLALGETSIDEFTNRHIKGHRSRNDRKILGNSRGNSGRSSCYRRSTVQTRAW